VRAQIFLRGAVPADAKIYDLYIGASESGTTRQLLFKGRPERLFARYLKSLGIGIPKYGDAKRAGRFFDLVFAVV